MTIRLEHGQPIRFGADGEHGVVRAARRALQVVDVAEVDEAELARARRARGRPLATRSTLSRLADLSLAHTPIGVFRDVARPVYDDMMADQLERAAETQGPGDADALDSLLTGIDTWTVS